MPEPTSVESKCIICRILDGSELASFVYRDDRCSAFMDIQPVNPGHILVVSNEHIPLLGKLDTETAAHLMRIAQRLTVALRARSVVKESICFWLMVKPPGKRSPTHTYIYSPAIVVTDSDCDLDRIT